MKDKHIQAYMEAAEAFARCSSAERLKVGCVIVKDNNIVSTGYNGLPEHIDGPLEYKEYMSPDAGAWLDPEDIEEKYPYRDEEYNTLRYKLVTFPEVRHAEKNALMHLTKSNESSVGATMFCTHSCCRFCAIDIVDSGIVEFIYRHDYRDNSGIEYLEKNGVKTRKIG
jgi:dCMP deaminase